MLYIAESKFVNKCWKKGRLGVLACAVNRQSPNDVFIFCFLCKLVISRTVYNSMYLHCPVVGTRNLSVSGKRFLIRRETKGQFFGVNQ